MHDGKNPIVIPFYFIFFAAIRQTGQGTQGSTPNQFYCWLASAVGLNSTMISFVVNSEFVKVAKTGIIYQITAF